MDGTDHSVLGRVLVSFANPAKPDAQRTKAAGRGAGGAAGRAGDPLSFHAGAQGISRGRGGRMLILCQKLEKPTASPTVTDVLMLMSAAGGGMAGALGAGAAGRSGPVGGRMPGGRGVPFTPLGMPMTGRGMIGAAPASAVRKSPHCIVMDWLALIGLDKAPWPCRFVSSS